MVSDSKGTKKIVQVNNLKSSQLCQVVKNVFHQLRKWVWGLRSSTSVVSMTMETKNFEIEQLEKFTNIQSNKEGVPPTFKPPNFV